MILCRLGPEVRVRPALSLQMILILQTTDLYVDDTNALCAFILILSTVREISVRYVRIELNSDDATRGKYVPGLPYLRPVVCTLVSQLLSLAHLRVHCMNPPSFDVRSDKNS